MANSYNELFGLGTHSVDASLAGYWKLQETTGTTAVDDSGNGNDLNINAMGTDPTVDTGPNSWLPSAFDFDGTDDYTDVTGPIGSGDNQTFLAFIKIDNDPPIAAQSGIGIFGESAAAGTASHYPYSDGVVYCSIFRNNGSTSRITVGNPTPSLTSWRELCVKTTPGADGWKFRIDGSDISSQTGLTGVSTPSVFWLGRSYDGTNFWLDGKVAGAAWFNRYLSDAEEAEAFAGPEPIYLSGADFSIDPTVWAGNTGLWDDQDNGTVTIDWELRDSDDDSLVESGSSSPNTVIGASGSYNGEYYLLLIASNDGGNDSEEIQSITDSTMGMFTESVTSTMSLTSDAVVTHVVGYEKTASSTIAFGDTAFPFLIPSDRQTPSHDLGLNQVVFVDGWPDAAHELAFTDEAIADLFPEPKVTQNLNLQQSAVAVFGVPWEAIEVEHNLNLSQNLGTAIEDNIETVMVLTDVAVGSLALESVLAFTHQATAGKGFDIDDPISFDQSVSTSGSIWNKSVTSALSLTSSGLSYNPNNKCDRRFGARPQSRGSLTLRSKDGLHEVVLRNPETDNIRRLSFNRIIRETRGGTLTVFRDDTWLALNTLLFTVVATKTADFANLRQFLINTLGLEIVVIDWLGVEWEGVVTKPDEIFTEDREGYWTFTFEFEGVKLDSSSGTHNLSLTQTAVAQVVS